jgi:dipeptidase E
MDARRIVGLGGAGETDEQTDALMRYLLDLTGKERPRVCYVPTASADAADAIVRTYDRLGRLAEVSHLPLFPWPPEDARGLLLGQDLVFVGGGNTANMLAIWRVHGIQGFLREAWEAGVLLAGWSAGMICWFESGVTDSFGPGLTAMDCLGWLPGSACPHYDGEELRRPRYRELIAGGLAPGLAADDSVGVRYDGTEAVEVVTARAGATAYRVDADGETALRARLLAG